MFAVARTKAVVLKRWKDVAVVVHEKVDEKRGIDGVVLIDDGSWLWQHFRSRGHHLRSGAGDAWSWS